VTSYKVPTIYSQRT